MSIDYSTELESLFHVPAIHDGIQYLDEVPDWIIRPAPSCEIRLFSASDDAGLNERMEKTCEAQRIWHLTPVFEVRSSPVLLRDAEFARGLVRLSGRILLSGASGSRARVNFRQKNSDPARSEELLKYFRRSRSEGQRTIGLYGGDASKMDVALELRNGFNYYHFTAETLGNLCHYKDNFHGEKIRIHRPGKKFLPFMRKFVDDLFPEIADRVDFTDDKARYGSIRSVFGHSHYLYTVTDPSVEAALAGDGIDPRWPVTARNPTHFSRAAKYSFDSSLRMLREVAHSRMDRERLRTYPKRLWIARKEESDGARARGLTGHEPFLEELRARGFERLAFEELSPIEQVEAMYAAEIVIAPHGAGLVNMIYAQKGARVVEIGTRQTQLHRWGDFLKCSHVSQCKYDVVFADISGLEDLSMVPRMSEGHRGIQIGRSATDRLISIVDEEIKSRSGE